MRIIRFLLTSVIAVALIAGVFFLLIREVLLFVATSQVRSSLTVVKRSTNLIPGTPAPECQSGGVIQGSSLVTIYAVQLAFQNDRDFRWELVCDSPLREPVILAEFTLPPLVQKVPGSSGLLWREPYSTFAVEIWGRQRSYILQDRELSVVNGVVADPSPRQPVTACSGLGYQCCGLDSEVGSGGQATLVRDCPLSCYAQCLSRPVILSLTSQPYPDLTSRQVEVRAGETRTYSYLVDPGQGRTAEVTLQFGDGESHHSSDVQGSVDHTYRCQTSVCHYQVQLSAIDDLGTLSATSDVATLDVVVTQR